MNKYSEATSLIFVITLNVICKNYVDLFYMSFEGESPSFN
jgi:hypothetical protein